MIPAGAKEHSHSETVSIHIPTHNYIHTRAYSGNAAAQRNCAKHTARVRVRAQGRQNLAPLPLNATNTTTPNTTAWTHRV